MFTKFLAWIKELINKMIGQDSLKRSLNIDLAVSAEMSNALSLWSLMYTSLATWTPAAVPALWRAL